MSERTYEQDTAPRRKNFFIRWIRRILRWLRNLFAFIGVVYTVVPLLLIWALFHSGDVQHPKKNLPVTTKEPYSLWLYLESGITEHAPYMGEEFFRQIFGGGEGIYLPNVRAALRKASGDTQVKDLQIVINGLAGSPADIEELRSILSDFKAAGKPMTAWVAHLDDAALMVGSLADKINLNPVSEVSLPGPAFPMTYFGDALKKLGVEMQVIKTGKFKSAFEAFVSNEPSAESREALGSVERSLRDQMVKAVATGRKKQDSEVFLWFKESFFTPAKAKELGIVDELAYVPYVDFENATDRQLDDYESSDTIAGKISSGYSLHPDDGLGLIEAVGEIVDSSEGENKITPDSMDAELNWALHDDNVKALIIRIASPGGSAAASDIIWNRIRAVNEKKPVIISMGGVAASGGYYMAAGGRKIFADASTITGSIGVIGMIPNLEGLHEKFGVSFFTITQSNRAAVLGNRKMTPADQSYVLSTIQDVYRTFKSRVAASRNMSMEKVEELAQGRVYTGSQAKENGLIDEIGTLKDSIQYAKKVAGLDESKAYPIHRYESSQLSLSECLTGLSQMRKCFRHRGASIKSAALKSFYGAELQDLNNIKSVRDLAAKHQTLAILPVEVKL
jgi:protease IV